MKTKTALILISILFLTINSYSKTVNSAEFKKKSASDKISSNQDFKSNGKNIKTNGPSFRIYTPKTSKWENTTHTGYDDMTTWVILSAVAALISLIILLSKLKKIFLHGIKLKEIFWVIILIFSVFFAIVRYSMYKFSVNYALTIKAHYAEVISIALSPDEKYIASLGRDGFLKVWNTKNGKIVKAFPKTKFVYQSLAFSPDGKYLAAGGINIRIYDTGTWEYLKSLYADKKRDKMISKLQSGGKYVNMPYNYSSIAFSPDSKRIAANHAKSIKIWDIKTGKAVKTISGENSLISGIMFSQTGKKIYFTDLKDHIYLWAGELKKLETHKNMYLYYKLHDEKDVSSEGDYYIWANFDNSISLYKEKTKTIIKSFIGHSGSIKKLLFSRNGKFIYSCSKDQTIRKWRIKRKYVRQEDRR